MNRITRSSILSFLSQPRAQFGAAICILLAVNGYICRELFTTEYTQHMGSIEGAYIALSRWIMEHPWELKWFPLWYGGIPFQNAYPPLLHLLVALVAAVCGISAALSHHAVTAALYCLGPVTLFWFACKLSGERWLSFWAALFYSVISPSAILIPAIANDMGGALGPRRLHALVNYGEGPHVASMTLLPLALLALNWALSKRRPVPVYIAAAALASVVLTNWLGAFALAGAVLACLLARSDGDWPRMTLAAAGIGVLAYAIAAPWIPPSTLADIRRNAQHVVGSYPLTAVHLLYAGAAVAAIALLWLLLERLRVSPLLRFAAFFSLLMGAVTLTHYWFGIYIVPQPERYHLEMEMALALLLVFIVGGLCRRLRPGYRAGIAALGLLLAIVQAGNYREYARSLIQPIDIRTTIEYQAARWLDDELNGLRVFASGSTRFWLNAFADNPQLGGGFDQGIVNPRIPAVAFGITFTENDGERTAAWLRVYGVKAIVVGGPKSRDVYRDYHDPRKFDGILPELWSDGDDVIYAVPQRSQSLAHVIRPANVVKRASINFTDVEPMLSYHAALEDPDLPLAELVWQAPHEAAITADLHKDHIVSVQITYHPGWRASLNGEARRISRDGLGFMVIEPQCEGRCTVDLVYDGGAEMLGAKLASGSALIGGFIWWMISRRRRQRVN